MTRVDVRSFLRMGEDSFVDIAEAHKYSGDCTYVPGAISLRVDGVELFGLDLWDDVNWLWPLFVQVLDESRKSGSGKRGFPDQPISIRAERAWSGHTRVRIADGDFVNRTAVASDSDLHRAVAVAGLEFFAELRRLCPSEDIAEEELRILKSWITP